HFSRVTFLSGISLSFLSPELPVAQPSASAFLISNTSRKLSRKRLGPAGAGPFTHCICSESCSRCTESCIRFSAICCATRAQSDIAACPACAASPDRQTSTKANQQKAKSRLKLIATCCKATPKVAHYVERQLLISRA